VEVIVFDELGFEWKRHGATDTMNENDEKNKRNFTATRKQRDKKIS
jgi:hypothetical protein